MNPPDDSVITFIREWLWAPLLGLIAWAFNHHTQRLNDLRDYVDAQDTAILAEVNRQRDNTAKLFDKLDDHARRSEDRHVELLNALHKGLAEKADR